MSVIYKNGTYYGAGGGGEGADTEIIADDFDPTESYAVGEYVVYEGVLYKCTTTHTGAWDASDFEDTQVMAEMPTPMPAADMSDIVTPLPGVMSRLPVYRNLLTAYDQELTTQKEIIGVTEDGYKVCRKIYAGLARGASGSFNTVVTGDTDLQSIASYFDVVSVHGVAYGVVGEDHQVMELSVPYIVLESGSLLMHQNYTSSTMTYNFRVEVVYVDRSL